MKKLNKVVLSLGVAGVLFSGAAAGGSANKAEAAWSYMNQSHYEKGVFIGWADGSSFEVKTIEGKIMVFRTSNTWYKKNLVSGRSYTYLYDKNSYGQNIITQINK